MGKIRFFCRALGRQGGAAGDAPARPQRDLPARQHRAEALPAVFGICPETRHHRRRHRHQRKTTVCNMLGDILRDNGYTLLDNRYGSNTNSGVASSLISGVTAGNRSRFDFAVFEVDERSSC